MTSEIWPDRLRSFLHVHAFPLWRDIGVDEKTGLVWESLDHYGRPNRHVNRRIRVQMRQVFCFARSQQARDQDFAFRLYRRTMRRAFCPRTGHLVQWIGPDARILTAPHNLYDLSFFLLATAALIERGYDLAGDLARLEMALARLKAPWGWSEDLAQSTPRRQNPHMHLFEAFTALFVATGAARFQRMAEECLDLFQQVFLTKTGYVTEYFNEDWTGGDQALSCIEPGHMAEWIFLIDQFERATGQDTGIDLARLFDAVLEFQGRDNLLPDQGFMPAPTRRLWPQAEFLKAALTMQGRGLNAPYHARATTILAALWRQYFITPIQGGWFDKRGADGKLLSCEMPASSFYHIVSAFDLYLSQHGERGPQALTPPEYYHPARPALTGLSG